MSHQGPMNPHYDSGTNYETITMDQIQPSTNGLGSGDTRLSARMTMDASYVGNNTDDTDEYEKRAMEELIDELPSNQLSSSSRDTGHRKSRSKSFRQRTSPRDDTDAIEDEMVEALLLELDEGRADFDQVDAKVKTMHTTLSRKKKIMKRLSSRKGKRLSRMTLCKYWTQMAWSRFKYQMGQGSRFFHLWRGHLMTIEGHFGTGVLSYFIFLKWVLFINIPIFLLTVTFLVVPQVVYRYKQDENGGYDNEDAAKFTGEEMLTGEGFFDKTEMYYGYYTNKTIDAEWGDLKYDMKYAYLFTCGGYYLFCLIILGYSYLRSYRKFYIEASGQFSLYYFSIVLCGWDFGIVSKEASQLKHKSIFNEFQEYLSGRKRSSLLPARHNACRKWMYRGLAWFLVLALLGASGYATYMVSTELSLKESIDGGDETKITIVTLMTMPVIVSAIQLFVPMVFTFIERYEQFSKPKYELYVHMFRDMALKATLLAVLVYFWFVEASTKVSCWETFVGQELYRLVIVDFLFTLAYSFIAEFGRKLLSLKFKSVDRAEFAIGRHTLELVYSQALCWLGVFYAPLLPLVAILKLIVIFYVKRISVVQNCKPSLKPWRASRTHTIFIGYLFGFFILSCVAIGCGIFLIKPSTSCGPYKNYETTSAVISELIETWKAGSGSDKDIIRVVFDFIQSPGFVAGVFVILGVVWYYTRTIMLSHKEMVNQFKRQLHSEGKDKKFLMNLLNQVKVRGGRLSHHQGPLTQSMDNMSQRSHTKGQDDVTDQGNNKVFVRTVAESSVSASSGGQ